MSDDHPETACCGDFCGKCNHYSKDCEGCTSAKRGTCHFVACCLGRGIEHCGICHEFPCAKLRVFVPDDRPGCPPGYHLENLKERTRVGTEAWLARQRRFWGGT